MNRHLLQSIDAILIHEMFTILDVVHNIKSRFSSFFFVNMASSDSCLIHFDGRKGPLTTFTEVSFQKFLDCRSIWLTLDGEHRDVARRSLEFVSENVKNVNTTDSVEYGNFAHHRACYSAFTNNVHIKHAQV